MRYIKFGLTLKLMMSFLLLAGAVPIQEAPKTTYCTPRTGCMCIMQKDDLALCSATGERTAEKMGCSSYCDMSKCHCCPVE